MLRSIKNKLLCTALTMLVAGCSHQAQKNPLDPLEPLNREVFGFNQTVDKALIRPAAYMYSEYLPSPFQSAIGNFFDNFRDVNNLANEILQLKFKAAISDTSRVLINTTIGLLGFFDPASAMGLERHRQDFGQTLYFWGYKKSIYLVLPLLGPSTIRDAIGIGVDYEAISVWPWINTDWKYGLIVADGVDLRARMLAHETVLKTISIDNYAFFRSAYLQRREYLFNGQIDKVDNNDGDTDPYEEEFGNDEEPMTSTDQKTTTEVKTEVKVVPKAEAKTETETKTKVETKTESTSVQTTK